MLKAYSSYFVSYLLSSLNKEYLKNIERIVLFGSAARDEAGKDSDVDIFIETKNETKKFKEEIEKISDNFYQSREATLFKSKGIENKINIKIGKLKEWKDIYRSVASDGIILYSHYESRELPSDTKHNIIVFWDKIGKNRGAFLNKIYGFKIKDKRYEGLISKFNGKKLGKSCVMFPVQYKLEIFKLLKAYNVNAKSIEVFI